MAIKNLQIPSGSPKLALELAPKAIEFHGTMGGLDGGRIFDPAKPERSNDHFYSVPNGVLGGGLDALQSHKDYFTALAAANVTDEERKTLLQDAHNDILGATKHGTRTAVMGDPRLAMDRDNNPYHALASARIEEINNFVWAFPGFMQYYATEVTLAPDEQPFLINETMQEISVTWIGEDGTPVRQRVIRPQARTPVPLYVLSTAAVRYKTFDVYRGDVRERTTKVIDIARDLKIKLDLLLFGLMNLPQSSGGCFGPFSYENTAADPELRIWQPHSGIDVTQLPTTNDLDLTATPGSATNPTPVQLSAFGINIIPVILDYANRWGDIFDGGALVPTGEILVPAADISNIAYAFLPVANGLEQRIQEEINRLGYFGVNYLGKNWYFIPSLFIQRGTCYPRFNKKPGVIYSKPALDREWVEVNIPENWEERYMRKVVGALFPAQHRIRTLRIKYATQSGSSSLVSFPAWQTAVIQGGANTEKEPYPTIS